MVEKTSNESTFNWPDQALTVRRSTFFSPQLLRDESKSIGNYNSGELSVHTEAGEIDKKYIKGERTQIWVKID